MTDFSSALRRRARGIFLLSSLRRSRERRVTLWGGQAFGNRKGRQAGGPGAWVLGSCYCSLVPAVYPQDRLQARGIGLLFLSATCLIQLCATMAQVK